MRGKVDGYVGVVGVPGTPPSGFSPTIHLTGGPDNVDYYCSPDSNGYYHFTQNLSGGNSTYTLASENTYTYNGKPYYVTTPSTNMGRYSFQMTNGSYASTYLNKSFVYTAAPSITSMSPTTGLAGTTVVTLTGSGFGSASHAGTIHFGGTLTAAYTSWSDTSIVFTVPAGATTQGPYDVSITTSSTYGSLTSNSKTFTVAGPTITIMYPANGPAGTIVTLEGTYFGASKGTIHFGDTPISSTSTDNISWSATKIVFRVPAGATAKDYDVYITTSGGIDSSSDSRKTFTVGTTPPPGPSISGVYPPSDPKDTYVTLMGSGFGNNIGTVWFAGDPAEISLWKDNQIAFHVPADATTGTKYVSVEAVGGSRSNVVTFNVTTGPVPTPPSITFLYPFANPVDTSVTILGENFGSTTDTLYFDGINRTANVTTWSDWQIILTVPSPETTGFKPIYVEVGGKGSNTVWFNVTSLTPSNGPSIRKITPLQGRIGRAVTLKGKNFKNAKGDIYFDTGFILRSQITQWTDTQVTFIVPNCNSTGYKNVYVRTSGLLSSNTVQFDVTPDLQPDNTPSITGINTTEGPVGIYVTLTGMNLGAAKGASKLYFDEGEIDASDWADGTIIFRVPLDTPSTNRTKEVYVEVGGKDSNSVYFYVTSFTPDPNWPSIADLAPKSGPRGTVVTIEGEYFGAGVGLYGTTRPAGSVLYFGEGRSLEVSSWDDSSITFAVPQDAPFAPPSQAIYIMRDGKRSNSTFFAVTTAQIETTTTKPHCYPNPFNPKNNETTTFVFELGGLTKVGLYIYDLNGRMLFKKEEPVAPLLGVGTMVWDGKDANGKIVANGVYIANIVNRDTNKLIGTCKVFVAKK